MGQCSCCRVSIGTGVHCRVRGQREEKLKVDGDSDGDLSDPGGVGYKVACHGWGWVLRGREGKCH